MDLMAGMRSLLSTSSLFGLCRAECTCTVVKGLTVGSFGSVDFVLVHGLLGVRPFRLLNAYCISLLYPNNQRPH